MQITHPFAVLVLMVGVLAGFFCGIRAIYFLFQAAGNRQPNVSFLRAYNIVNLLFQPDLYTDTGLQYRCRFVRHVLGFFACLSVAPLSGWLQTTLRG